MIWFLFHPVIRSPDLVFFFQNYTSSLTQFLPLPTKILQHTSQVITLNLNTLYFVEMMWLLCFILLFSSKISLLFSDLYLFLPYTVPAIVIENSLSPHIKPLHIKSTFNLVFFRNGMVLASFYYRLFRSSIFFWFISTLFWHNFSLGFGRFQL